jgi:uncharacterized protein (DUF2384 family)
MAKTKQQRSRVRSHKRARKSRVRRFGAWTVKSAKTSARRRAKTAPAPRKPAPDHPELSGAALLGQFLNEEGKVVADRVAEWFGMSKGQLGATIGVSPETLQRFSREFAPHTQSRLREMLEIVGRVTEWAGGADQAMAWYRAEPIRSFGDRTAEFLVKEGKAEAVRNYLDRVALGGFA